jgi:F0F1-type ATP synthase epsilon subunit
MKQEQVEEFSVTITNAEERIWEGVAHSVSSKNSAGQFDILPGHANFVTMVKNEPIVIRNRAKEDQTFIYKTAVLTVKDNKVKIYSDI